MKVSATVCACALLAASFAAACAAPGSVTPAPSPLALAGLAEIPVFEPGDPRVGQAGFVRHTLRLHRTIDEVRYTLMAFVVGDRLSLGAMVKGAFAGEVRFRLGSRSLAVPFDAAVPGRPAAAIVDGDPAVTVAAAGATAMGTAWTMVELPVHEWIADATPLQLTFAPTIGPAIALPEDNSAYRATLVAPPQEGK